MPRDPDKYDFFVSYARRDNRDGWITRFVEALLEEHRKHTGGRELVPFFDTEDIRGLDDWRHRIYHGLADSRLLLAFISPGYFASEWCRREWRAWIDVEIAKHILSTGAAPIYIIEVPGLLEGVDEQDVARSVAELCESPPPREAFIEDAGPLVRQFRRRQLSAVQPFYQAGVNAMRQDDLRRVLKDLAINLDKQAEQIRRAATSETTVPPYNRNFTGRLDELLNLRERLKNNRAGVISGLHGLGGVGKTELAFTFAHAFAGAYPGGRFLVPCEGKSSLREAALVLGDLFREQISDEQRMTVDTYFAAVTDCLRRRLDELGPILLVLDNVTDPALLAAQETDSLTRLGPMLHLLATTRLPAGAAKHIAWVTLGELPEADALALLEKHRAPADETEWEAARRIVHRLGGFALAVELVAAWLAAHEGVTYAGMLERLGLEDLDTLDELAEDADVELRRHNHERRLAAVLAPALEGLSVAERRAVEYAACLAPDHVPLPWLRELVGRDFPEITQPPRPGYDDPWDALCRRLVRLAVFRPAEGEGHLPRLVRVHRLVQDLVRRDLPEQDLGARKQAVEALVRQRDADLENTTRWEETRWEIEPLEALALLWDESDHPQSAWLLNQVGQRWHALADWSRAEPMMRRALMINESSFGPEHVNVAIQLNNLAQLLKATNRLAEAEPLYRRLVEILENPAGDPLPNYSSALSNFATLLQDTNRLDEAEPLLRRVLAFSEASFGPNHPDVARDLCNLAGLLYLTNRLTEAEPLMRRALAIDKASFGPDHPNVALRLNNLATLLLATNRPDEAEPLMRRALAIDEASFGLEHPDVARDLNNLAQLLLATHRLDEAEPLSRRQLDILLKFTGATGHQHPHLGTVIRNHALLLRKMGHAPEEVSARLVEIGRPYGVQLGGGE